MGCGIVIEDDDEKLVIGMCMNKNNIPTDAVFTLFLINKTSIISRTRLYPYKTVKVKRRNNKRS